ncbi:hypothetical protein [Microvirga calopogonii]|uniref:hypothetical protein n=1 Tax=Microvirga calopogonii TaxID=2078013 RepID=UPI000E0DC2F9|nr:hypothetical protein [Microvirga calopogonii]
MALGVDFDVEAVGHHVLSALLQTFRLAVIGTGAIAPLTVPFDDEGRIVGIGLEFLQREKRTGGRLRAVFAWLGESVGGRRDRQLTLVLLPALRKERHEGFLGRSLSAGATRHESSLADERLARIDRVEAHPAIRRADRPDAINLEDARGLILDSLWAVSPRLCLGISGRRFDWVSVGEHCVLDGFFYRLRHRRLRRKQGVEVERHLAGAESVSGHKLIRVDEW